MKGVNYKSAIASRAWPRPLPGAYLRPPALLVVADLQYGIDLTNIGRIGLLQGLTLSKRKGGIKTAFLSEDQQWRPLLFMGLQIILITE